MKIICREIGIYLLMIFFFAIMSLGMALMVNANLGLHPWGVLEKGLSFQLPLSYGRIMQITGLACIAAGYLLKVKPGWGTLLNMFFIGFWVDLYLMSGLISKPPNIYLQLIYLMCGVALVAYGTALYISLNRGTGPRDSLMVGLSRLTGRRMGLIRTYLEVTVVTVGVLLGGPLGLGTLIFALTIGGIMESGFALISRSGKRLSRITSRKA